MSAKSLVYPISMAALLQTALQTSIFLASSGPGSDCALAVGRDTKIGAPANHSQGPAHPDAAEAESKPEAPPRDYSAPTLGTLAKEYKDSPDDVTFGKYFTYLRDVLISPDFSQANPADIIAANPNLSELHVRVIDTGYKNMRLWSFPAIGESHAVIFATPGHTTAIPLPLSIVLHEGRIVPSSFASSEAVAVTRKIFVKVKGKRGAVTAKTVRVIRSANSANAAKSAKFAKIAKSGRAPASSAARPHAETAASLASFGKYLVLIGGDRQTNALWLKGFKLGEGALTEATELFASLPVFFSQNVSGKAAFSGSDIVLTIQPPAGAPPAKDESEKPDVVIQANGKPMPVKLTNTALAGYKVVLKYLGGKFALAGHVPDDAPLAVAMAFAQNICAGRSDVAKGWLIDAKLASIPKYLGLIGRATPTMRLVAMSGTSGARYRLITSAKDDLIIDIGRITTPGKLKGRLAVKGLFIAPPDPYAAQIAGTPVLPLERPREGPEGDDNATLEIIHGVKSDADPISITKTGTKSVTGTVTNAGTKPGVKANQQAHYKPGVKANQQAH